MMQTKQKSETVPEIGSVQPEELQAWICGKQPLQVIDVREFPEFAGGRIGCAHLLPLNELEARADQLDRNTPLVCVCRSGKRSAQAASRLRALGFHNVTQLEGGLVAWEQKGLPLTRDAHAPWSLERQVRFALGLFVLAGLSLSLLWSAAIVMSWIVGVGMVFTAVLDWCGMALLLAKAPWNTRFLRSCAK